MPVKLIDPLVVCITSKKNVRDNIAKALSGSNWPVVFQETPDQALQTRQDNLTTVILDPLYYTACPKCGRLDDWGNKESRCSCGFLPKKGKNPYNDWPEAPVLTDTYHYWEKASKLIVVVLPHHAPKYMVSKLRDKGYWAVRLKKDQYMMTELPKVIKHALKTMSKFHKLADIPAPDQQ